MTGIELCLIIFLIAAVYVAGIALFIYGVNVESGWGVVGFIILIVVFVFSHIFAFSRGTVNVASNNFPTSLREGVIYTSINSVEVVGKDNQNYFLVWASWNNSRDNALYKLRENPPNRFYIDERGNFLSVDKK